MKGIMILGTASDVGKSLIVTAICRLLSNEGVKVAPFKSQNMSNNSYVTVDGKEIGRAQGIQAEAAKTEASVWMNPILLKPRSDMQSEIVLFGKAIQSQSGKMYRETFYDQGVEAIQSALNHLHEHYDVIVCEGAGSPVEINLKDRELVNMKVAEMADIPVILVADIDRGGVFASLVGTLELLTKEERARVKGLIINKFRGDISLFENGISWLEEKTGIPVLGVLPYMDRHGIDGEDSLSIDEQYRNKKGTIDLAVIRLPYISNFSDIEPFSFEEDVSIRWVKHSSELGNPDAVIIPGTKSTINDLNFLKKTGLDTVLKEYAETGGFVVGICGGYQMLGSELIDSAGSDTGKEDLRVEGLNIIPTETRFYAEKETIRVKGTLHSDTNLTTNRAIEGYEIHLGQTTIVDNNNFLQLDVGRSEGYYRSDGKIIGTYLHHLFHNDEWRNLWLNKIRQYKGLPTKGVVYAADLKEDRFDQLAANVKAHLDWQKVKEIIHHWGRQHEMD